MKPKYYVNIEVQVVSEMVGKNREYADQPEPLVLGIYSNRDLAAAEAIKAQAVIERKIEDRNLPREINQSCDPRGAFRRLRKEAGAILSRCDSHGRKIAPKPAL